MRFFLKLLTFSLMLICFQQAWASIPFYQAEKAYEKGDFNQALEKLSLSEKRHFLMRAKSLLKMELSVQKIQSLHAVEIEKLHREAKALQKNYPKDPKLYLDEAIIQLAMFSEQPSTEQWDGVNQILRKAYENRGANLWVVYRASLLIFENRSKIKKEDLLLWLGRLKNVVKILPENYLLPALSFMQSHSMAFEEMDSIVPQDADSYDKWLRLVEKEKRWDLWAKVYEVYMSRSKEEYANDKREAILALSVGDFVRANEIFQKMTWRPRGLNEGKIGLLSLEQKNNGVLANSQRKLLHDLLLAYFQQIDQKDELISVLEVGKIIEDSENPLLKAHYAYWQEDYKEAVDSFKRSGVLISSDRYYFAKALDRINQKSESIKLLQEDLQKEYDQIDLKNLFYLLDINPLSLAEFNKVLDKNKPFYKPASSWSSKQLPDQPLKKNRKTGMVFSLPEGPSKIVFAMKKTDHKKGQSPIIVRLSDQYVATVLVSSANWKTYSFDVDVKGGRYWFEVESVNPEAAFELGTLRIKSPAIDRLKVNL